MDLAPAPVPPLGPNPIEDRLLALSRALTPAAKLRQIGEMVDSVAALAAADLARHDPTLAGGQVLEAVAARRYGRRWLASMLRREGTPAAPGQGA